MWSEMSYNRFSKSVSDRLSDERNDLPKKYDDTDEDITVDNYILSQEFEESNDYYFEEGE